jgi:hypothetical protein
MIFALFCGNCLQGGLGLRGNFGSTANDALGLNELDLADIPPAVQV